MIGHFDQDDEDVELMGGKENRDADVVDLLEGSMDNEEREFGEEVGIRPYNSNV
jgi:hypothetical protein